MTHSMTIEALGSACYSSLAIPAYHISCDGKEDREAPGYFDEVEFNMLASDADAWSVMGYRRHIIGVALGDIVLTRDEAFETLRWQSLEQLETVMEDEA